jgi:L-fucose mutarotase
MLTSTLIHPELLAALAGAGHGAKILIADGNFPHSTAIGPNASVVRLNLAPGHIDAVTVLAVLLTAVSVERAEVMSAPDGTIAPILGEFRSLLGDIGVGRFSRSEFYEECRGRDLAVVVATGEQRLYANLLLTIGVVTPNPGRPLPPVPSQASEVAPG